MSESNFLLSYFEKELKIANDNGQHFNSFILECQPEIKSIICKADKSGWTGSVAPYFIHSLTDIIKHVLSLEPLTPLTFKKDEWNLCGTSCYQNNRLSSIFCEDLNGPYHDIYACPHKYTHEYYMDNDTLVKCDLYSSCWNGSIYCYDESLNKWYYFANGLIKNPSNFSFGLRESIIPVVELKDRTDPHNDYFAHVTYIEAIPDNFFKQYDMNLISDVDEIVEKYIYSKEFISKFKLWKKDLLEYWKHNNF